MVSDGVIYYIKVVVTDRFGNNGTDTFGPIAVPSKSSCNNAPTVAIELDEAASCVNVYGGDDVFTPAKLSDGFPTAGSDDTLTDSSDLGDSIVLYTWTLLTSDGSPVDGVSPFTSTSAAARPSASVSAGGEGGVWAVSGGSTYQVQLTVKDLYGSETSATTGNFTVATAASCNNAPTVAIELDEAASCVNVYGGDDVFTPAKLSDGFPTAGSDDTLTDSSDLGDSIVLYTWTLLTSDGSPVDGVSPFTSTSAAARPSASVSAGGEGGVWAVSGGSTYQVQLTVKDLYGSETSATTGNFTVATAASCNNPPIATLSLNDIANCSNAYAEDDTFTPFVIATLDEGEDQANDIEDDADLGDSIVNSSWELYFANGTSVSFAGLGVCFSALSARPGCMYPPCECHRDRQGPRCSHLSLISRLSHFSIFSGWAIGLHRSGGSLCQCLRCRWRHVVGGVG